MRENGSKPRHELPQCHMLPQLRGCSGELHKPNALIIAIFLELPDAETLEVYVRHLSTRAAFVGTLFLDVKNKRADIHDTALVNEGAVPRSTPTFVSIKV